ncbi:hypothetical protein ANCDUO_12859 [Ancylostoma duodenale]|uniref:Uncharacterized protein n=1 Tax=Ancylostoma duodenale TaxID=51022 RepID=A0A0C2GDL7_9BILA|nr:hypothetical protein ANCDUO_12859 [Ancylostoma duodenale]
MSFAAVKSLASKDGRVVARIRKSLEHLPAQTLPVLVVLDKSEEEKPLQARSTHFQKTRTHMLMQNLFEMFPAGNSLSISDPPGNSEPMDTDVKPEVNEEATQSQPADVNSANPGTSVAKSK